jgi:hypothetical protein
MLRVSALGDIMKTGLLIVLAAALAASGSASSARSGLATHYGHMTLFGGYSDKQVEAGVWRVSARSNGPAGRHFAGNMAAYRAAEILSAQGFTYIQVLDAKGDMTVLGQRGDTFQRALNEHAVLTVRGAYSPAPPADCRAKQQQACATYSAAQIMTQLRPLLDIGG